MHSYILQVYLDLNDKFEKLGYFKTDMKWVGTKFLVTFLFFVAMIGLVKLYLQMQQTQSAYSSVVRKFSSRIKGMHLPYFLHMLEVNGGYMGREEKERRYKE